MSADDPHAEYERECGARDDVCPWCDAESRRVMCDPNFHGRGAEMRKGHYADCPNGDPPSDDAEPPMTDTPRDDEDLLYDLWRHAFSDGGDAVRGVDQATWTRNRIQTDAAMNALRKRLRATAERPERAPVPAVDRSWSTPDALAPAVPSSVSSAIEEEANAARRRNEADEHFDEDAQICECGHRSRNHAMKAFKYACCHHECDCNAFRGRAT